VNVIKDKRYNISIMKYPDRSCCQKIQDHNESYLKIKKTVEEKVRTVLTDGKALLQFTLASLIEAIRRNPDKYDKIF
jgi:hypothetical protein